MLLGRPSNANDTEPSRSKILTPITFLRPRLPGPEQVLEDTLLRSWERLFKAAPNPWATLGGPQVGAGNPDLTFCSFEDALWRMPDDVPQAPLVLGYLRGARRATGKMVALRTNLPERSVDSTLGRLKDAGVVVLRGNVFELEETWRLILPEVISVEVKVRNWKSAIAQAVRNVVFATRSYIALPDRYADRACAHAALRKFGIGVVSVSDDFEGVVGVRRRARQRVPRVWSYYYELARTLVRANAGGSHGVRRTD